MTQFYFRIRDGRFGGPAHHAIILADRDAAWTELTQVSKDLLGSITREITQNAEWQIELLDESKTPLFRIRLVSETLDGHPGRDGDQGNVAGEIKGFAQLNKNRKRGRSDPSNVAARPSRTG
jgi:hypothetical protein